MNPRRAVDALAYGLSNPAAAIAWVTRFQRMSELIGMSSKKIGSSLQDMNLGAFLRTLTEAAMPFGGVVSGSALTPLRSFVIYAVARLLEPRQVVETGVASGVSSALILKALEENRKGALYSIDLPDLDAGAMLPPRTTPGWIIPDYLRSRWRLVLGKSKMMLDGLLNGLGDIELFLHDSDHSYVNMIWELSTAWKYLKTGGVLLVDDIHSNKAFADFVNKTPAHAVVRFGRVGAVRK